MVLNRMKEINKDFLMVSPLTESRPNERRPWLSGPLVLDKDCFRKMYKDTKYYYKKLRKLNLT